MSVAEILAAARAEKAAASAAQPVPAPESGQEPAAVVSEPTASSAGDSEASVPVRADSEAAKAGPSPVPKPGSADRPSVKDILAMARKKAEAQTASAAVGASANPTGSPKPAEAAAAKATVAPKAGAAKAAAKPAALPRDTASILAAARSGAKPGPSSKAEAGSSAHGPGGVVRAGGDSAKGLAARTGGMQAKPGHAAAAAPAKASPLAVPPKPARPAAKKDVVEEDRRGFLEIALGSFLSVGFTALSISGGLFTLGLARFLFPNVLAEPPSRFKVGFKEGFPAGKVETKYVAQYGVWVVNSEFQGQQQIYALKTVCTHLGCTPNWLEAEQKFKCPCHGSGFYKDGINFEGPAPRPLERYAIRIADDGQLEVDKSRAFQEELGQWGDPASYVTV